MKTLFDQFVPPVKTSLRSSRRNITPVTVDSRYTVEPGVKTPVGDLEQQLLFMVEVVKLKSGERQRP